MKRIGKQINGQVERTFHPCCALFVGAGIAQWYSAGLRVWWSGVRVPGGAGYYSLHHRVQAGSVTHRASYLMGIRGSLPGGKAAGAWSWPLTSEVTKAWSYTSTPSIRFHGVVLSWSTKRTVHYLYPREQQTDNSELWRLQAGGMRLLSVLNRLSNRLRNGIKPLLIVP
jgi:hypothetical protein